MVEFQRDGGVARIFLNRPQKVNALDSATLDALVAVLARVDDTIRVVVLGGHGRAFCGGADVDELRSLSPHTAREFIGRVHRACDAVRRLPVPVVARLHGAVIGAGLELAAACDLRVAARGTRFAMPEVRLGIPSVVEAALLPRLMGSGRAAWLVLTAEPIDAERAREWGLVETVAEDLDRAVSQVVDSLLAGDAAALRAQKELLQIWEEQPLAASVAASIERFAQAYTMGRAKAGKEH
ncbi:MAG TPA: enoyl-CoA hydratase-related protein [Burkholderiales bacterium]|jgi:enoyl-CoA hydratase|nr:enoyl-CoA hydratase-related protein [Burkholderiales bacterium]